MDDLELTLKNQQKYFFCALYVNTKQESGEGITAKVDFDVSSKIKSRLSDSTDQWVLKKSEYFESKGRNGIRILENNIFQKIYFSISFVFP